MDGEWCTVTIDDSFPCNARSLSLAFARGRKNQVFTNFRFFNFENSALGSLDRKGVGETLGKLCEIARRQNTRGVGYADWYANVLN